MAGLLARLFGRREKRDFFGAGLGLGFMPMAPGSRFITPIMAENLSTVLACIQAISGTISSLPASVYRLDGGVRTASPAHAVAQLILAPNERQTWPDFIEWWVAQSLAYGNGLAGIEFDQQGRPVELVPIPWQHVSVHLLPTRKLAYDVVSYYGPFGGTGLPRRWLQDEVLHLKDRSDDSYLGRSRISRAPDTIENALGLQSYSNEMWRNGVSPSGVFQHPGKLRDEVRARLKTDIAEHTGVHRSRKTLLLEDGMTWAGISLSPQDAETLNSRKFSTADVCRLFSVPPPILQDWDNMHGVGASGAASVWFGQFCVGPWLRKIEAEFGRTLLSDPFQLQLDVSGLMRGDYAQRVTAAIGLVNAGVITPNEARLEEGLDPHPDGNMLRTMPGAAVPGSGQVAPASLVDAATGGVNGLANPKLNGAGANGSTAA